MLNILRKEKKAQWYQKNKKRINAKQAAKYATSSEFYNRRFDTLTRENRKIGEQMEQLQEIIERNRKEIYAIAKLESEKGNPKFKNYFSKTR